mmetsp:Transcript_27788/g.61352  ORF Transcript_27788/g.61352 Transcript_27788/m.61352 type:complete len:771 (+) Transcript_27788:58-2370(+)
MALPMCLEDDSDGGFSSDADDKMNDKLKRQNMSRHFLNQPTEHPEQAREVLSKLYHAVEQQWLWQVVDRRASLTQSQALGFSLACHTASQSQDMVPVGSFASGKGHHIEADDRLHHVDILDQLDEAARADSLAPPKDRKEYARPSLIGKHAAYILDAVEEHQCEGDAASSSRRRPSSSGDVEINPLKELLLAKKPDIDKIRECLEGLKEEKLHRWINTPLEPDVPYVPAPLLHAVVLNSVDVVALLLRYAADVSAPYDGESTYKGVLKPGMTVLQSVRNRMGRFVGTMLGDKLQSIEEALSEAEEAQQQASRKKMIKRTQTQALLTMGSTLSMKHRIGHPSELYEVVEHLADGDTSSCWLGFRKGSAQTISRVIKAETKTNEEWLWREIGIMQKLNHPNITKLCETYETDSQIFMIVEFCSGGSLAEKIESITHRGGAIVQRLLRQQISAVRHIHARRICHRGIQLDNFLLADRAPLHAATLKLIDFTTAKDFSDEASPMITKVCTPTYVACEILSRKVVAYTEKVDIWSLGVAFFIALCGYVPFKGETEMEILKSVKSAKWTFAPEDAWKDVPQDAKDLVSKMICKAEQRLSANEVIQHAWMEAAGDGVGPVQPAPPQEQKGSTQASPKTRALKAAGSGGQQHAAALCEPSINDAVRSISALARQAGATVAGSPTNAVKAARRSNTQEVGGTVGYTSARAVLVAVYKACEESRLSRFAAKPGRVGGLATTTPGYPVRSAATCDAAISDNGVGTMMGNLTEDCGGAVTCP